jgi:microcystin-dependent protein
MLLTPAQMPGHSHGLEATAAPADRHGPTGALFAMPEQALYAAPSNAPPNLDGAAVGAAGGNQPHDNVQPFLCVNFIISLFGIFPSQN